MQLKEFNNASPMDYLKAAKDVKKQFAAFYKQNNIQPEQIISFTPTVTYQEPFGYIISLWVLLNR